MSFSRRKELSLFGLLALILFVMLAACQPAPTPTSTPTSTPTPDLAATIAKQTVEAALAQPPTAPTPNPPLTVVPSPVPSPTANQTVSPITFTAQDAELIPLNPPPSCDYERHLVPDEIWVWGDYTQEKQDFHTFDLSQFTDFVVGDAWQAQFNGELLGEKGVLFVIDLSAFEKRELAIQDGAFNIIRPAGLDGWIALRQRFLDCRRLTLSYVELPRE